MKQILPILLTGVLIGCNSPVTEPLADRLRDSDSMVVLHLDSRKPSKVDIFHCTIEKTIHGPTPPTLITASFLNFPGCEQLSVGNRYLCAIRHGSGTGYTFMRSDMLEGKEETALYTCAWALDSLQAKEIMRNMGAQQADGANGDSAAAPSP